MDELLIELPFLKPFEPVQPTAPAPLLYSVRKDNTISWKSNLYSVPLGTYRGRGSQVGLQIDGDKLIISDVDKKEICTHVIVMGAGQKVINSTHKRDKYVGIDHQITELCKLVHPAEQLLELVAKIQKDKPRYMRDQLLLLKSVIKDNPQKAIHEALRFSIKENISSATDFKTIVFKLNTEIPEEVLPSVVTNPLNSTYPEKALSQPKMSRIEDYQTLLCPQIN